ncbi:MAG: hypothetical protein RIM23_08170 [Coleofasciculus sp. G3-WIS-01]
MGFLRKNQSRSPDFALVQEDRDLSALATLQFLVKKEVAWSFDHRTRENSINQTDESIQCYAHVGDPFPMLLPTVTSKLAKGAKRSQKMPLRVVLVVPLHKIYPKLPINGHLWHLLPASLASVSALNQSTGSPPPNWRLAPN